MTLIQLNKKNEATIEALEGDAFLVSRLNDLGLHKGLRIRFLGRAPFGGPIIIEAGTTVIALRDGEAQCIRIQKIN